jgi:hypothetical protein
MEDSPPPDDLEDRSEDGRSLLPDGPPAQTTALDGIPTSFSAGGPTLVPQREFLEKRRRLPDADEQVKQAFRLLAQESIIALTRGSSNPLKGVDDWLDRLGSEGEYIEGSMEQLFLASRDHLRKMRVYELGIRRDSQAKNCGDLATLFEVLHDGFFKTIPEVTASENLAVARNAGKYRGFRKVGDFWEVAFDGVAGSVKHTIGIVYIARLLRSPGRSFGCVELAQAGSRVNLSGAEIGAEDRAELSVGYTKQALHDPATAKGIKAELSRIRDELADAEFRHDAMRIEHLRTEKDNILAHVKKSFGRAGRPRAFPEEDEKARKAVDAAIRRAIVTIRKSQPVLADHLQGLINRGVRCWYEGDGSDWDVVLK